MIKEAFAFVFLLFDSKTFTGIAIPWNWHCCPDYEKIQVNRKTNDANSTQQESCVAPAPYQYNGVETS